jgi:UDP-3-O-[3-hydroxymyristoyl] glucosamine N-acyltransferase
MKLNELASKLELSFKGNPELDVIKMGDIESPADVDINSIYFVQSKKYLKNYSKSKFVNIALTTNELSSNFPNAILVDEKIGKIKFIQMLSMFEKKPVNHPSISDKAIVDPSSNIGKNVTLMPNCLIMEGCEIGDDCIVYPGVVIEKNVKIGAGSILKSGVFVGYNCNIGKNNLIHSNTVIGADGFGFFDQNGERYKIPQIGNVIIGDNVELGAMCTIDRATIESTLVGNHTKFDDHVHLGHNCRVGNFVYIAGGTVLAGSVIVEDNVTIGGQSAIAEHVKVKKNCIVMGLTGVTKDTEEKTIYFGIPARPVLEHHRLNASINSLPELIKRVKALEE